MKLENKTAVVTGAGSGMGRAIAILFAAEGASVVVSDINKPALDETMEIIRAAGNKAVGAAGNVASQADVDAMIDLAVKEYGTLDILVNNAGIMDNFAPAANVTDEMWQRVFAVNTTGPMMTIRKSIPIFLEHGHGVIVNISSLGGLYGSRAGFAYTASKHALIGMTKNVAFQYAKDNIRCNAIAPGAVATNISQSMGNVDKNGMDKAMLGMALNPGMGQPEDIAAAALFLASDEAKFINGAVVTADGGWSAY